MTKAIGFISKLLVEFFLGGLFVMLLTDIIFPIFGHPGLSYLWSGAVAILIPRIAK